MARGWNAFRDCPHEGFCLTKKECMKNEKRNQPIRDGNITRGDTVVLDIRESWNDPTFTED